MPVVWSVLIYWDTHCPHNYCPLCCATIQMRSGIKTQCFKTYGSDQHSKPISGNGVLAELGQVYFLFLGSLLRSDLNSPPACGGRALSSDGRSRSEKRKLCFCQLLPAPRFSLRLWKTHITHLRLYAFSSSSSRRQCIIAGTRTLHTQLW